MANQFESKRYKSFPTWQKVFFWIGILSFISPAYWLVRLILYLVLQNEPIGKRVDAYAMQTFVFGILVSIALIVALIVIAVLAAFLVATVATTSVAY